MTERSARREAPEIVVLTFPSARELARRVPRLVLGILLLGCGIAPVLEAELGVAPWDVFHQGIADATGLSFGVVTVLVGVVVLLGWIPLRQRIGPIGHWFLARFHLGVGGVDPDPTATIGE